jgi:hypothetical protein
MTAPSFGRQTIRPGPSLPPQNSWKTGHFSGGRSSVPSVPIISEVGMT